MVNAAAPPRTTDGRFAAHHATCDKGWAHGYLTVYDRLLIGVDVRAILEVGIMDGASLAMWADVFPDALIVGIEADSARAADQSGRWPNVEIVCEDAYDRRTIAKLVDRYDVQAFDFVIDDGSHQVGDQLAFVERYPNLLRPGGVLVVEDVLAVNGLHTAETIASSVPPAFASQTCVVDCRWPGSRYQDDVLVVVDTRGTTT